jgi:AbrB family looped-hinge helix DNA binding protein
MNYGITLDVKVTGKGTVTIPYEIRSRLGIKPKDRVLFQVEGDRITIAPAKSRVAAFFGAVKPTNRPEIWKKVREETEQAIAEEVMSES